MHDSFPPHELYRVPWRMETNATVSRFRTKKEPNFNIIWLCAYNQLMDAGRGDACLDYYCVCVALELWCPLCTRQSKSALAHITNI
jgi:hypothetical protein